MKGLILLAVIGVVAYFFLMRKTPVTVYKANTNIGPGNAANNQAGGANASSAIIGSLLTSAPGIIDSISNAFQTGADNTPPDTGPDTI
jgi:hypothetical protein